MKDSNKHYGKSESYNITGFNYSHFHNTNHFLCENINPAGNGYGLTKLYSYSHISPNHLFHNINNGDGGGKGYE